MRSRAAIEIMLIAGLGLVGFVRGIMHLLGW